MADGQHQPIAPPPIADAATGNGRFDIAAIAAAFPPTAETLLVDE